MKIIWATPLLLLVGGCLSLTYQEVERGAPSAVITFSKGYDVGLGDGAMDNYAISNTGNCDGVGLAARFMSTTGNMSHVRIPSNQRVLVIAHVEYFVGEGVSPAPGGFTTHHREFPCTTSASFVPRDGASYSAVNRSYKDGRCRLEIVDQATNMPPPDIQVQAGSGCPKGYASRYGAITFLD